MDPASANLAEREEAMFADGEISPGVDGDPEPDPASDNVEEDGTSHPRIPRGAAFREKASAAQANSDSKAQKEEALFASKRSPEQLAADAAEKEHDRTQHFRDAFEKIAIGAMMIGAVTILVLGVIWALHLVLPAKKRWLTPEDLTHIQTLLTAGVLVGVVSSHFKKRLGDLK